MKNLIMKIFQEISYNMDFNQPLLHEVRIEILQDISAYLTHSNKHNEIFYAILLGRMYTQTLLILERRKQKC